MFYGGCTCSFYLIMNLYSLPYRKSAEQRNKHRFSLLNQSFSLFRSAEQIGTECGTTEQIGGIHDLESEIKEKPSLVPHLHHSL